VRPITLGVVDGERAAVTAGLAAGERVVTEGGDRLRDGREGAPCRNPARRPRRHRLPRTSPSAGAPNLSVPQTRARPHP
jgi:multidrug efflux system membrane fusion protein